MADEKKTKIDRYLEQSGRPETDRVTFADLRAMELTTGTAAVPGDATAATGIPLRASVGTPKTDEAAARGDAATAGGDTATPARKPAKTGSKRRK